METLSQRFEALTTNNYDDQFYAKVVDEKCLRMLSHFSGRIGEFM